MVSGEEMGVAALHGSGASPVGTGGGHARCQRLSLAATVCILPTEAVEGGSY